jgi:predicted NodU family carbamoyl transferase
LPSEPRRRQKKGTPAEAHVKLGSVPDFHAVTHVDGSGRLQTVTRESNPRYYALIEAFRALTGIA